MAVVSYDLTGILNPRWARNREGGTAGLWGTPIPISWGRRVVPGQNLWFGAVVIAPFLGQPQSEYLDPALLEWNRTMAGKVLQYSFAVDLGEPLAPLDETVTTRVVRIWNNDKLVFDATSPASSLISGNDFRFYKASETGGADSTIVAFEGEENTPGFRGHHYMVFTKFVVSQLTNFQGATFEVGMAESGTPQLRVELSDSFATSNVPTAYTVTATIHNYGLLANWEARRFLAWAPPAAPLTFSLVEYDIDDRTELRRVPVLGLQGNLSNLNDTNIDFLSMQDKDNDLVLFPAANAGTQNIQALLAMNIETATVIAQFGDTYSTHPFDGGTNNQNAVPDPDDPDGDPSSPAQLGGLFQPSNGCIVKSRFQGTDIYAVVEGSTNSDFGVLEYRHTDYFVGSLGISRTGGTVQGDDLYFHLQDTYSLNTLFGLSTQCGQINEYPLLDRPDLVNEFGPQSTQDWHVFIAYGRMVIQAHGGYRSTLPLTAEDPGTRMPTPEMVKDYGVGWTVDAAFMDPTDGHLCVFAKDGADQWLFKYKTTLSSAGEGLEPVVDFDTVLYAVEVPTLNFGAHKNILKNSQFTRGTFGYPSGGDFITVNLGNGSTTENTFGLNTAGEYLLNEGDKVIVPPDAGNPATLSEIKLGVQDTGDENIDLADAIRWLMYRAGLEDADFEIDPAIDDTHQGGILTEGGSLIDMLQALGKVYQFFVFDSGGKIKVSKTANAEGAVVAYELEADDIAPISEGDAAETECIITEIRRPVDTAGTVRLFYIDPASNYTLQSQQFIRTKFPADSTTSTSEMELTIPIVMTAAEAMTRVTRIAFQNTEDGITQTMRFPWKFSRVEPGDVVGVTFNGFHYTVRLIECTFNFDMSVSVAGANYAFSDAVTQDSDDQHPFPQEIFGASDSRAIVIDAPLVSASDDPTGQLGLYTGVGSYGQPWYSGAFLMRKLQGAVAPFANVFFGRDSVTYGTTPLALPDFPGYSTQPDTLGIVLRSHRVADVMESCTRLEAINGVNQAFIGRPGRWELIHFEGVTEVSPKVATLDGVIRGMRGTEQHVDSHQPGDTFVLVSSKNADFVSRITKLLHPVTDTVPDDKVFVYQADGLSGILRPKQETVTIEGNSKKPWAVAYVRAEADGSDNIDISWQRRDRLSRGVLYITDDVPMTEETEEYEVDILHPGTGAVLRTYSGLVTPAAEYTAAHQTTDGFTPPVESVRVKIYQISALVGRGMAEDLLVTVT